MMDTEVDRQTDKHTKKDKQKATGTKEETLKGGRERDLNTCNTMVIDFNND